MLVNIDNLVPQDHFLRKLDATVSFEFVYEIMAPLYSDRGRPSVAPALLIKMLLIGYFYNIDSERKLEEEVNPESVKLGQAGKAIRNSIRVK